MRIISKTEISLELFIKRGMSQYSKSVSRSQKNLKLLSNLIELMEA